MKDWLMFREEDLGSLTCEEDKKHWIYFDEISEKILRNVPDKNKKYVAWERDVFHRIDS